MNKASSEEALSILNKWREDGAILLFSFTDAQTGKARSFWVFSISVTSEGSPTAIFSDLSDPYRRYKFDLKNAKYEYGDHREFSEDEVLVGLAEKEWVCFLSIQFPTGNKVMLSEPRREPEEDFFD